MVLRGIRRKVCSAMQRQGEQITASPGEKVLVTFDWTSRRPAAIFSAMCGHWID